MKKGRNETRGLKAYLEANEKSNGLWSALQVYIWLKQYFVHMISFHLQEKLSK